MAHGTGMTESYLYFNFPIEIYQASFPIVRVAYLKNATKLALQKKISLLLCFGYLPSLLAVCFCCFQLTYYPNGATHPGIPALVRQLIGAQG